MSHLTELSIECKDKNRIDRIAKTMGWSVRKNVHFRNSYSGEQVQDATILTDKTGRTKMVVRPDGKVVVDTWDMGTDHQKFLQNYAADHLKEAAMMDGGMLTKQEVDQKTGDIILEIAYV